MKSFTAVVAAAAVLFSAVPSHAQDVFMSLTRDPIPLSDAPTNTQVITSADFEKSSALTVGDVLADQPGIMVQTVGSQGSLQSPFIRGFAAQQVLVVIDDVPQTPDLTGNVDLSRIPLDNVDRIEIVRGGASAVYGPDAEGGVIHIITKHPHGAVDLEATSEAGSYGTYNNSFSLGTDRALSGVLGSKDPAAPGPLEVQVSGSRNLSNGFQQNSSAYNTALDGFFAYNAGTYGKLSYNIEGSKGKIGLPSGTPVPIGDWNGDLEREANDTNSISIETDRNNRVQYENQIGGLDLTARVANNVKDLDTFQFGETLIRTEGRNAFTKLELPGDGALGYEFYERRLDSVNGDGTPLYGEHQDDSWGTFYEAYFLHNDWIHLTPGVRYDHDDTYGSSWSPRVDLVITPSARWKVSASANRSFQAPTFADLYNPFVPAQFQPTGLQPEITWTYNVGASVRPTPASEISVTLFRADTRNRIALNPNEDFAAFNLDRAYSQGVEAEASYTYSILRQQLAYTYLEADGQSLELGDSSYQPLAFSPRHKIDYQANVQLPWQLTQTVDVDYLYKQWTSIDQGANPNEPGLEIPDHVVVNLRLSKKIGWAELFIACNNVLDRHYAETADNFDGYFPQPGRNYLGGVTVRFLK